MVEAALVLPVVLVAVFGCLEFIQVGHAMAVLHQAAAAGARAAALGADPTLAAAAAVLGLMPPRAVYGGVTISRARLSLENRGGVSVANPPLMRVTATARALYRPPLGRWPMTLKVTAASLTEPVVPR